MEKQIGDESFLIIDTKTAKIWIMRYLGFIRVVGSFHDQQNFIEIYLIWLRFRKVYDNRCLSKVFQAVAGYDSIS